MSPARQVLAAVGAAVLLACGAPPVAVAVRPAPAPPAPLVCKRGLADCDHRPDNGCEAFLYASEEDCGACGVACAHGERCLAGSCVPSPVEVSAAALQTCAVTAAGVAYCWGDNTRGQLGDGTLQPRAVPTRVRGLGPVAHVSLAREHGCAVLRSGEVACWGLGYTTDTAPGDEREDIQVRSAEPRRIAGVTDAIAVTAGAYLLARSDCAVRRSGEVACWRTVLGGSGQDPRGWARDPGVISLGVTDVVKIAAGRQVCMLHRSGTVDCWKEDPSGQFGEVTLPPAPRGTGLSPPGPRAVEPPSAPVPVPGLHDIVDLVADWSHTCALSRDEDLYCWGSAKAVGVRPPERIEPPGRVQHVAGAATLAADYGNTLVLQRDGTIGWASGTLQIRHGDPLGVPGMTQIAVGWNRFVAATRSGAVYSWGENEFGAFGSGETDRFAVPVEVPGVTSAVSVAVGSDFSCAVTRSGEVVCWGYGRPARSFWSYVDPSSRPWAGVPEKIRGLDGVVALAADHQRICAIRKQGLPLCWKGGLQPPWAKEPQDDEWRPKPLAQPAAPRLALVSGTWDSRSHAFVGQDRAGRVTVWKGAGPPRELEGLRDVVSLAALRGVVYGVARSGELLCVSEDAPRSTPAMFVALLPGATVVAASAGDRVLVGRRGGGVLVVRQQDISRTAAAVCAPDVLLLHPFAAIDEVVEITGNTCMRRQSGQIVCWHVNEHGQNGIGTFDGSYKDIDHRSPIPVLGLDDAVSVSASHEHACAVRAGGRVVCWGSNEGRQLGQPDRAFSVAPVRALLPP